MVSTQRPGLLFVPSPALAEFMESRRKRQMVRAANRIGKTYQAAAKLARRMIETPNLRCRAVGPTSRTVCRVHARYLWRFLRGHVKDGTSYAESTGFNRNNTIELRNGSICQLMSYEQDTDAHAGDQLHVVWLDEPPPEDILAESEARTFDLDGEVWITLTAVGRPTAHLRRVVEARGSGWVCWVVALTPEAVPWLPPAHVRRRIRREALRPWQYQQRILGAWDGVTESRRFVAWDPERHLLLASTGPADGWPVQGAPIGLALSADYGEGAGNSFWLLWGWQVYHAGGKRRIKVRALGEWTNKTRVTVEREAKGVARMIKAKGLNLRDIRFGVGDINTDGKSSASGSLNESFEEAFRLIMRRTTPRILFRPARKGSGSIEYGIGVVNQALDGDLLQVSDACVLLVEALNHWAGGKDDLKHRADTLRYGLVAILDELGGSGLELRL
jgi:phage terminase large subunit-like protein